jgi:hypothetical protein
MIAVLDWLKGRAWVRWLLVALGVVGAGLVAFLAGRRDGVADEHARQSDANRKALGDTAKATDALDARIEARREETEKQVEAIDAKVEHALANPPTTDEAALAEAKRMAAELDAEERSET